MKRFVVMGICAGAALATAACSAKATPSATPSRTVSAGPSAPGAPVASFSPASTATGKASPSAAAGDGKAVAVNVYSPAYGHPYRRGATPTHTVNDLMRSFQAAHAITETPDSKLERNLWCFDDRCRVLADHCKAQGIAVDVDDWKRRSWVHRVPILRNELAAVLPPRATFVFIDQQHLAPAVPPGRTPIPFLQRDGEYWGNPADDEIAIRELAALRRHGASFVVIGWPGFWWLDHYRLFAERLRNDSFAPPGVFVARLIE